ncbi:unnamed protein product [Closterium sp. NIES-65]|nr:unnamed protein product [Closterium sp. NIES-65]
MAVRFRPRLWRRRGSGERASGDSSTDALAPAEARLIGGEADTKLRDEKSAARARSLRLWGLVLLAGVTIGALSWLLATVIVEFFEVLYALNDTLLGAHATARVPFSRVFVASLLMALVQAALVGLAAVLTVNVAPLANGSGVPEIKGFLNGNSIPGFFELRTTVVKFLGLLLVVAAGMPVGREGPMAHIGAGIAVALVHLPLIGLHAHASARGKKRVDSKPRRETGRARGGKSSASSGSGGHHGGAAVAWMDRDEQRAFVTYGGAAGVAAAFKAPIGGVLFMFEEVSSFWSTEATFKSFVSATISTLVIVLLVEAMAGIVTYEAFLLFVLNPVTISWTAKDVGPFLVLGVVGGLLSRLYTVLSLKVLRARRTETWRRRKAVKIIDAAVSALVVSLLFHLLPAMSPCISLPPPTASAPAAPPASHSSATSTAHVSLSPTWHAAELASTSAAPVKPRASASLGVLVPRYDCPAGHYNELATLLLRGEEGAVKHLMGDTASTTATGEAITARVFPAGVVGVFLIAYSLLAASISGLAVPSGQFIPQLLYGAALGRLYGMALHAALPEQFAQPSIYAHVGSAACLAGYTHLTISLAVSAAGGSALVMLMEASGDISLLLPILCGYVHPSLDTHRYVPCSTFIGVAKAVAQLLGRSYDEVLLSIKKIPFLQDKPHARHQGLLARHLMDRHVAQLREMETPSLVRAALIGCLSPALMVVDVEGGLKGVIAGAPAGSADGRRWQLGSAGSHSPLPPRPPVFVASPPAPAPAAAVAVAAPYAPAPVPAAAAADTAADACATSTQNELEEGWRKSFEVGGGGKETQDARERVDGEERELGGAESSIRAERPVVGGEEAESSRGAVGAVVGGGEAEVLLDVTAIMDPFPFHVPLCMPILRVFPLMRKAPHCTFPSSSAPFLSIHPYPQLNLTYVCVVDSTGQPAGLITRAHLIDAKPVHASVTTWGHFGLPSFRLSRCFSSSRPSVASLTPEATQAARDRAARILAALDPDALAMGDTVQQQAEATERVNLASMLAAMDSVRHLYLQPGSEHDSGRMAGHGEGMNGQEGSGVEGGVDGEEGGKGRERGERERGERRGAREGQRRWAGRVSPRERWRKAVRLVLESLRAQAAAAALAAAARSNRLALLPAAAGAGAVAVSGSRRDGGDAAGAREAGGGGGSERKGGKDVEGMGKQEKAGEERRGPPAKHVHWGEEGMGGRVGPSIGDDGGMGGDEGAEGDVLVVREDAGEGEEERE